jgi:1,4-dihydroxy-2-naphthoate octaprenyltransferase
LNNFRDIYEDAEISKRTLAVRFGVSFARMEIAVLTIVPFLLNCIWFFLGYFEAALIPVFLIPIAFLFVRSIWKTTPGPLFNRYFALSVFIHFSFGLFLIIGFCLKT